MGDNSIDALVSRAEQLYDEKSYRSAIKIAKIVLAKLPGNYQMLNIIASSFFNLNQYRKALPFALEAFTVLENSLSHNKRRLAFEYDHMLYIIWYCYSITKDYDTALSIALQGQHILQGKAKQRWNTYVVLDSLIDLKRYEEAENVYGKEPADIKRALWDIGYTLAYGKNYKLAYSYFLRHLSLTSLPRRGEALLPYIECLLLTNRYKEASTTCLYWMPKMKHEGQLSALAVYASVALWASGAYEESIGIYKRWFKNATSVEEIVEEKASIDFDKKGFIAETLANIRIMLSE